MEEIAAAQKNGDMAQVKDLMLRKVTITQKLHEEKL